MKWLIKIFKHSIDSQVRKIENEQLMHEKRLNELEVELLKRKKKLLVVLELVNIINNFFFNATDNLFNEN